MGWMMRVSEIEALCNPLVKIDRRRPPCDPVELTTIKFLITLSSA